MEVSNLLAAKAIAENRAVLADAKQRKDYFEQVELRKQSAEKAELSRRLQIAIISDADFRSATTRQEKEELSKG
jgi:hypothetical protein